MTIPRRSRFADFTAELTRLLARDGIAVHIYAESPVGVMIDAWRTDRPGDVGVIILGRTELLPFTARRVAAQIRVRFDG